MHRPREQADSNEGQMPEETSKLWGHNLVRSSIYLSKDRHKRLTEISRCESKRVHELIVEGIDKVIAERDEQKKSRQ